MGIKLYYVCCIHAVEPSLGYLTQIWNSELEGRLCLKQSLVSLKNWLEKLSKMYGQLKSPVSSWVGRVIGIHFCYPSTSLI